MIETDIQRLEQDAVVQLFEIDATQYGGEIVRFSTAPVDGAPPVFDGQTYFPFPVRAEGFEWNGRGTLPRPTLTAASLDVSFLALVIASGDLVGAPVRRIRTFRKHLDDGSDPDPTAVFPIDYYVIERKTSQTRNQIQFELSVQMDQEGVRIPARQIIRDSCSHRYRFWNGTSFDYTNATCPYVGADSFDGQDNPTDSANDRCSKRLNGCRLRFGQFSQLPFYGFPGVGRF